MGVQKCPVPDCWVPLTLKKCRRQIPERNQQFIFTSDHVMILAEINEVLNRKVAVCVQILKKNF